ncbi:TetR family transcriptional regulator C-terminal domain-containing protein, partial [Salmonella enterica]|uniref:TetR family transcriptional regulator C-terminal domain-containing protein n=1 Tax=Salmonella enterica TaxID=28901 RepID=UPI003CED9B1C
DDPERKGCLICNTIIERAAHAPETLTLADARVAEVRAWFVEQLRAAAGSRDLRKDLDPEVVADSLVATTLGMMALARARTDRGALKTIADAA